MVPPMHEISSCVAIRQIVCRVGGPFTTFLDKQRRKRKIFRLSHTSDELRMGVGPVTTNNAEIRVAVAGAGAAGSALIEALDAGVPGCVLSAISARDLDAARQRFAHLRSDVAFVDVDDLEPIAD